PSRTIWINSSENRPNSAINSRTPPVSTAIFRRPETPRTPSAIGSPGTFTTSSPSVTTCRAQSAGASPPRCARCAVSDDSSSVPEADSAVEASLGDAHEESGRLAEHGRAEEPLPKSKYGRCAKHLELRREPPALRF